MRNSRKSKSRVFGFKTFSAFLHDIKISVNALTSPANQTQRIIPGGVLLQNNNLNSRESIQRLKRYRNGKS